MQKDKAVLIYIVVHCQNKEIIFVSCCFLFLKSCFQKNKKAHQNIQSIDFFSHGKYLSYRQNIVRFVIYGSELVEIDTLLAQFKRNSKFCFFGGHFVISS